MSQRRDGELSVEDCWGEAAPWMGEGAPGGDRVNSSSEGGRMDDLVRELLERLADSEPGSVVHHDDLAAIRAALVEIDRLKAVEVRACGLAEREAGYLRSEITLRDEMLTGCHAGPPSPAVLVKVSMRHYEAFERIEDAERWRNDHYPQGPWNYQPPLWRLDTWHWHPAGKSGRAAERRGETA